MLIYFLTGNFLTEVAGDAESHRTCLALGLSANHPMKVNTCATLGAITVSLVVFKLFMAGKMAPSMDSSVKAILHKWSRPVALIEDNPYGYYMELIMPEWLATVVEHAGLGEDAPEHATARLNAAMLAAAASEPSRSPPAKLSHYTIEDLVGISNLYSQDFGILMYNPLNDDFLLLFIGFGSERHPEKLLVAFIFF